MEISTLIFDLNVVLVTYEYSNQRRDYLDLLGVTEKQFWEVGRTHFMAYNCGVIDNNTYYSRIFHSLDLNPELIPDAQQLHWDALSPVKGMKPILKKLKGHYNMTLLAGDGGESLAYKVNDLGFMHFFDTIYATCFEGMAKDTPEIYRRLLSHEGVKPKSCLFIDDLEKHIVAASEVGINCIHFENPQQMLQEMKEYDIQLGRK